jgi:hypothetical protein
MRKGDGLKGKSAAIAPCLLQFKRSGRSMKRQRKSMPKGIQKQAKSMPWQPMGLLFYIFVIFGRIEL